MTEWIIDKTSYSLILSLSVIAGLVLAIHLLQIATMRYGRVSGK